MAPPAVDYSVYYVTGRDLLPPGQDYLWNLEESLKGGVTVVQLREKNISTAEFLKLAQDSKALCDQVSRPSEVHPLRWEGPSESGSCPLRPPAPRRRTN